MANEITEVITRRIVFFEYKIFFTTNSMQRFGFEEKWSNTFYIHFKKSDFPFLKYPKLVDGWKAGQKRFDYMSDNDLANLDWHGGITFYEETFNVETNETYIKAGCDFQHFMDDHWESDDHGELILKTEMTLILGQFLDLVKLRNSETARIQL